MTYLVKSNHIVFNKFVSPNLKKCINLKDIGFFWGQILHPNCIQYGIITFVCLHGHKLPIVKWRLNK
jgi:hypothetical protein